MKIFILTLLAIMLSFTLKAQDTPQFGYDVYPVFPSDKGNFGDFITTHIQQPQNTSYNLRTSCTLALKIDSTGKVYASDIYGNLPKDVVEEFAKVALQSPQWNPATLKGKPVRSTYNAYYEVVIEHAKMKVHPFARAREPKVYHGLVFVAVQTQPTFVGGTPAFESFIKSKLVYPNQAKAMGIAGRVFVQFVIETDGSLTDLQVVRDPGYGMGEEALRVLCLSPNWVAGRQNGKTVRVQWTAPINFTP
jgi:TonB family protein